MMSVCYQRADGVFLMLGPAGCWLAGCWLFGGAEGGVSHRSRGGLYIFKKISALLCAMSGKSISVRYCGVRTAPLICLDAGGDRGGEFAILENIDMLSFRICPTGAWNLEHFRLQQ
jgi:hypothetical protein